MNKPCDSLFNLEALWLLCCPARLCSARPLMANHGGGFCAWHAPPARTACTTRKRRHADAQHQHGTAGHADGLQPCLHLPHHPLCVDVPSLNPLLTSWGNAASPPPPKAQGWIEQRGFEETFEVMTVRRRPRSMCSVCVRACVRVRGAHVLEHALACARVWYTTSSDSIPRGGPPFWTFFYTAPTAHAGFR